MYFNILKTTLLCLTLRKGEQIVGDNLTGKKFRLKLPKTTLLCLTLRNEEQIVGENFEAKIQCILTF
jgi:hypothetical protein